MMFDELWPSYLAIENLSSPIENVIFKSFQHHGLWGVYPEVLMALAQNSWEISISSNRLGEKSQKPYWVLKICWKLCPFFQTRIQYWFYPLCFCNHWNRWFNSFPLIVGFLLAPIEKMVCLKKGTRPNLFLNHSFEGMPGLKSKNLTEFMLIR